MMEHTLILLVGTRRGIFRAVSDDRHSWLIEGPLIPGYEVYHAFLDPRNVHTGWAAVRHDVWGAHIYRSDDDGRSWSALAARPAFPDTGREVRAIWHLAPGGSDQPDRIYAGVQPAGLFVSDDRGETWRQLPALDEHPTREAWQPAKGGLALHSIQVDPTDSRKLFVALSAGGCYASEDGGESWRPINEGTRADFLPDPRPIAGQCVHALRLHPERPERLYQQSHCGTYRSDDSGESWSEITDGLPSDFGYVVGLDPADPDRCWVIPEESSDFRAVCDYRLRVFETSDGGQSWSARTDGLPQEHVYATILREALDTDGLTPCGVYFGTATGHLFASVDGRRWQEVAAHLPRILSVTATAVPSGG